MFIAQRAIKNATKATMTKETMSVISCPYCTTAKPASLAFAQLSKG